MEFRIQKRDLYIVVDELMKFKSKVSPMTKKINYLYEFPNICIEWDGDRRGFVSLGLYGDTIVYNSGLYDRDIEQHKKTLQSFAKYQDLFRKEFYKLRELFEKK